MNRKFVNALFTTVLVLGFFFSIFRGFTFAERDSLFIRTNNVVEVSDIKSVFTMLNRKVNRDTGDIKEVVNRYQYITTSSNGIKDKFVVVEVQFDNSAKSAVIYDILKTKLILKDGTRVAAETSLSAPFTDEFNPSYLQIGNLVFSTDSEEIKALEFPDGSVCGL